MAGAQQQQQNPDNSLAMLWGILLAFALTGLAWFLLHRYIAMFVLRVRLIEARFIALFFPSMREWVLALESFPSDHLSVANLVTISSHLGRYLRFPISLILIAFAYLIYVSRATLKFTRYYDMPQLVALEQKNWSQITPVVSLDLVNIPLDVGPWAMALTPFQFAKNNQLITWEKFTPTAQQAVMVVNNHSMKPKLKKEAAKHAFAMQLGQIWQGVDSLSEPAKALFAIFAARGLRDREAADHLLEQIASSATRPATGIAPTQASSLNFAGVDSLLKKHITHPLVIQVMQRHAYTLGVMASMLLLARQDGVLASAEFLWLKPYDRRLWFMLNCIGRQTAYAEVAAPFAHWIAERAAGHKLRVPMTDMAVEALENALRDVRLSPQENL